jgi:hypothetical protein
MKHGDKAKGKTLKASKASSGEKAGSKGGEAKSNAKAQAGGKTVQAAKSGSSAKAQAVTQTVAGKKAAGSAPRPAAAAGGIKGLRPDEEGFSNPIVAGAFKRAVKKYPNAFRKLTD